MSNTYTLIIRDIKDDNNDNIDLKIIFNDIGGELCRRKIKAFDTKGRYFYAEYAAYNMDECKEFEYYKNNSLNIIFHNFEGLLTIFLYGGGYSDCHGLEEQKDSPLHLQIKNEKIIEAKNQIKKLEEQIIKLEEQKTKINSLFVF